MAIKEFNYKIIGKESVIFPDINKSDISVHIDKRSFSAEDKAGWVDSYLISPGFYTKLFSNANNPQILTIGEETREEEFRNNLKKLINMDFNKI